ncbi:hypothetical protein CGCS363_v008648 [Colletotrichum siamense]|uniref:uncharacterized protein n=1 Tax=Colletotrichum siamense TaxID=690259 RepID=UPI0018732206|nr:uncharacterized protein CGCS363_v008648 [Colletotrichum siamense]KAF5497224.1 hypothetical protein CGCS363_v008648 [Colletotrichum siamense]
MAPISLYNASIPQFKTGLTVLSRILAKAALHFPSSPDEILKATLIEGMLPLPGHVLLVSNIAKKSLTRMAGITVDVWPDDEDTVDKLIARCERTIALLDTVAPEDVDGHEGDVVEFRLGGYELRMTAEEYLMKYAVPFFGFHLGLVYAMLRMKGVELGFADFLMPGVGPFLVEGDADNGI